MPTLINIDGRTLNVTHINTVCANPDALYAAEHPMLVVEPQNGGSNVIVLRSRYASRDLVIASEAFVPEQYLSMVLRNAVLINSVEGKRVQRLDASC